MCLSNNIFVFCFLLLSPQVILTSKIIKTNKRKKHQREKKREEGVRRDLYAPQHNRRLEVSIRTPFPSPDTWTNPYTPASSWRGSRLHLRPFPGEFISTKTTTHHTRHLHITSRYFCVGCVGLSKHFVSFILVLCVGYRDCVLTFTYKECRLEPMLE